MGTLKTSEKDSVVAGEGKEIAGAKDRRIDTKPKIIIGPGDGVMEAASAAPVPHRTAAPATATPTAPAARRGGLGLVVVLYLLSGAALAYAIYERFFQ